MKLVSFLAAFALAVPFLACAAVTDDDAEGSSEEMIGSDGGTACKVSTKPKNTMCPAVFDPVCGCDGKTYGNACEAARVVSSSTPEACSNGGDAGLACKLAAPKNTMCPAVFLPVCGCDGKTYGNGCEAARAVTSSTPGACSDAGDAGNECKPVFNDVTACPLVYDPVCGCNGKTYGNACEASLVISSSTPGACEASDAGVACKLSFPKNFACPAVYQPVCGCDGKTYGNACEASRVVSSSTPDACN